MNTQHSTLVTALALCVLAACQRNATPQTQKLTVTKPPAVAAAPLSTDEQRIADDVNYLADDRLEGRPNVG